MSPGGRTEDPGEKQCLILESFPAPIDIGLPSRPSDVVRGRYTRYGGSCDADHGFAPNQALIIIINVHRLAKNIQQISPEGSIGKQLIINRSEIFSRCGPLNVDACLKCDIEIY